MMYIITSGRKAHIAVRDYANPFGWATACGIQYIDTYGLTNLPCKTSYGRLLDICKKCQEQQVEEAK